MNEQDVRVEVVGETAADGSRTIRATALDRDWRKVSP